MAARAPRRVRHGEARLVLAQQGGVSHIAFPLNLPQVPYLHGTVQRCCGEEVRLQRMQREASNLLFRQLPYLLAVRCPDIVSTDAAFERREVEYVWLSRRHIQGRDGQVFILISRGKYL